MPDLKWLETIWPVEIVKSSFIAYPLINALHIAAIGVLFTSVMLLDLRLIGLFNHMPERPFVSLLRRLALLAFSVALLSGLLLFLVRATHYAQLPVFLLKLSLIFAAGLNFLVFQSFEAVGAKRSRVPMAATSILLWAGVLLCGRLIGFY